MRAERKALASGPGVLFHVIKLEFNHETTLARSRVRVLLAGEACINRGFTRTTAIGCRIAKGTRTSCLVGWKKDLGFGKVRKGSERFRVARDGGCGLLVPGCRFKLLDVTISSLQPAEDYFLVLGQASRMFDHEKDR